VHVRSFLIPQTKATELVQPREGTFYDPAPSSQTAAVFRIAPSEYRRDVTCTESTADFLCVVGPISQYAIGTRAGRPREPRSGGTVSSSGNAWVDRGNSLRSGRLPMECHARHRSNGACCPVWLDRSDSPLFAAPKNGSHRTTINNRMGPVDLAITRKPIQQHEVSQVPNSITLPIA
jgi:hypothetical protein